MGDPDDNGYLQLLLDENGGNEQPYMFMAQCAENQNVYTELSALHAQTALGLSLAQGCGLHFPMATLPDTRCPSIQITPGELEVPGPGLGLEHIAYRQRATSRSPSPTSCKSDSSQGEGVYAPDADDIDIDLSVLPGADLHRTSSASHLSPYGDVLQHRPVSPRPGSPRGKRRHPGCAGTSELMTPPSPCLQYVRSRSLSPQRSHVLQHGGTRLYPARSTEALIGFHPFPEKRLSLNPYNLLDPFCSANLGHPAISRPDSHLPVPSSVVWTHPRIQLPVESYVRGDPMLPLDWPLPSRSGPYEIQLESEPRSHHRAHYETEGSRGAVKAQHGGHPTMQLLGYNESILMLHLFVGTADERALRPHPFYQVHKVTGKSVTCLNREIIVGGTKVLEIPLSPANDMRAVVDCAGILKLRNADIELRAGETDIGRKNTRVRLVFRVSIPQARGASITLQATSIPIECSQRSAQELPLLERISITTCSVMGGESLVLYGSNFLPGSKVVFSQKGPEGRSIWEHETEVDGKRYQPTSLTVQIPPYQKQIVQPVSVQVFVCNSKQKQSQQHTLTYRPALADISIKNELPQGYGFRPVFPPEALNLPGSGCSFESGPTFIRTCSPLPPRPSGNFSPPSLPPSIGFIGDGPSLPDGQPNFPSLGPQACSVLRYPSLSHALPPEMANGDGFQMQSLDTMIPASNLPVSAFSTCGNSQSQATSSIPTFSLTASNNVIQPSPLHPLAVGSGSRLQSGPPALDLAVSGVRPSLGLSQEMGEINSRVAFSWEAVTVKQEPQENEAFGLKEISILEDVSEIIRRDLSDIPSSSSSA
uniref:nuclear factor of activated T-cells, cytoplasmic 1-like isoform X2 n=1 Tax=Myxine glutinosa TaxID=7769 RepID=UPI0035901624